MKGLEKMFLNSFGPKYSRLVDNWIEEAFPETESRV